MTTGESRQFMQGLAAAKKNAGEIKELATSIKSGTRLSAGMVAALTRIGLPDLFSMSQAPDATFRDRNEEVKNQLAKNRTGRFSAAAGSLDELVSAMQATAGMNPGTETFWSQFFQVREHGDADAVEEFAAEVAAAYSIVRFILRSDLNRRLQVSDLGHVAPETVAGRLTPRGIDVIDDLPAPTFEAVRSVGGSLAVLLMPQVQANTQISLSGAGGQALSADDLGRDDMDRALRWCDERGWKAADQKKALAGLRSAVSGQSTVGSVVTAYLLQLIESERSRGVFTGTIRTSLTEAGLTTQDAARLLNEQAGGEEPYPW